MRMSLTITPYKDRAELLRVRELFYKDLNDTSALETAVRTVNLWGSRGSLPHALNSTAWLVSTMLEDETDTSIPQKKKIMKREIHAAHPISLRNSYSMALVRFVNGILDPYQQGSCAAALSVLAKDVDLPYYFVEIRHWATHEHLPSLSVLQALSKRALDWLYMKFWAVLDLSKLNSGWSKVPESRTGSPKSDIVSLIKAYRAFTKTKCVEPFYNEPKESGESRLTNDLILVADDLSTNFRLAKILLSRKVLLKNQDFDRTFAAYKPLLEKLPLSFLLMLIFELSAKCFSATDTDASVKKPESEAAMSLVDLLLPLITNGPYPFTLYHQVYSSKMDVLNSLKSYRQLVAYINYTPVSAMRSHNQTRISDFSKALSLESILEASTKSISGKQKRPSSYNESTSTRIAKKPRSDLAFEARADWRVHCFGRTHRVSGS